MPTTDQLRAKLIEKLQELFQLDQPELDFGFYRIMHAKAEQVQRFLENDLLAEVQQAFADGNSGRQAELKAAYEDALAQARKFGAPDPAKVEGVMEAKAAYENALDTTKAEAEVYDHLYRFFERYYEDGDFVSRRYLTRETAGKAAPYAVPYDGQEVMLHWANRDQYYIKTSEHFDNYTFEAREAARQVREAAKKNKDQGALELGEDLLQGEPLRVHFRIVDAAEGEHNNVKESDKRYFIVDTTEPLAFTEAGELLCRFTYRPDPEKSGQEGTWRQKRNALNEAKLLETLKALAKADKRAEPYLALLGSKAPTGKQTDRSLLGKYIEKYSATNSKDYFIHKDLGSFLRRELDFYLKNEVMRLDDLEQADAPRVEHYLAKLKVIRRIAHKLIDFLAQLENFQKKLWLKKKFVVETNWCITLDRVPEALYPAIAANPRIKAEWEQLFHIQDLPGYEATKPLTVAFLKTNPYLVLDTAFLSDADKAALLNSIDDLEGQTNGLLVHSENFQALSFLEARYREQVKCVYIDPPYNTGEDGFPYKDSFRSSSWIAMYRDRLELAKSFLNEVGIMACHMDEHEHQTLEWLTLQAFGRAGDIGKLIWDKRNPKGDATGLGAQHEYVHFATSNPEHLKTDGAFVRNKDNAEAILAKARTLIDRAGVINEKVRAAFKEWIGKQPFTGGEKAYSLIDDDGEVYQSVSMAWPNKKKAPEEYFKPLFHPSKGLPCPVPERGWRNPPATMEALLKQGRILFGDTENTQPRRKYLLRENMTDSVPSILYYGGSDDELIKDLKIQFDNPKPIKVAAYVLNCSARPKESIVLDYFAGSGTTGHAVIELNRYEQASRKSLLVEMGSHFDTVTKPRMQKVIYSRTWKDGKPVDRDGISHCFKYIRLESYEDTLNALELRSDEAREKLLAAHKGLREDYTLRYMLDVETQGSASLLNHTAFTDPRAYTLNVKRPGSEERTTRTVDLLETFNYLLGLRVQHMAAPEAFTATFERVQEKDVPKESPQRLVVKGSLKPVAEAVTSSGAETWWFRKVQGWMPRDRHKPHGERDKVLIIWRTLTGDLEQDNAVLDTYFEKNRLEIRDREYDVIYVNGSNNLPNLLQSGDRWKVRLIEEDFHRLMWEGVE
jgi:adenine-specific DNA-methyltransferase